MKFDKLIESILNEDLHKMTSQQEETYLKYEKIGWEFSHWEDDNSVVMIRRDRGIDSSVKLGEITIKKDGNIIS
jgi:hypothetical protein